MKKWSIYIWLMLLVASCINEEPAPNNPQIVDGDGTEFSLSLVFQQEKNGGDTKAITNAANELKIDSMRIFVFKNSDGNRLHDLFMYEVRPSSITDSTTDNTIKNAKVKFKSSTEGQRFIVIANPPVLNLTLTENTTTVEQLLNQLKFSSALWQGEVNDNPTFNAAFPMFGQVTTFNTVGYGATTYPSRIKVNMIRALARVEIGVDINNNTGDPALGFGAYFNIHDVYVCNFSDSGYFAPKPSLYGSQETPVIDKPNIIPTAGFIKSVKYSFPASVPHVVPVLSRSIYIPERDSFNLGTNTKPTFLILKATYYGDTAYYKVNFVKDNKYAPVLRNHAYRFNITGLRKRGYDTFDEAYDATIESDINPNLILNDADADINDIVYNKNYYLGVSTTIKKIHWSSPSSSAGSSNDIKVKTSYLGGWSASVTNSGGFISSTLTISGGTVQNASGTIEFAASDNTTGNVREGEITVKAGELSQKIKIIQSPGSYSYIVRTGTNDVPIIPVASANIDSDKGIGLSLSPMTLSVAVGSSVSFTSSSVVNSSTDIIRLKANSAGPSIITLKNSLGDVVWSWLVWVVVYNNPGDDLNSSDNIKSFNGYEFMKYELGGTDVFFQWGRKDALITSYFNTSPAPASNSIEATRANPLTLYYNNNSPFDWKRDMQNNNLWIGVDGEKGIYDPCPFGWRVPPAENDDVSPWKDFTNGNNGLTFAGNTYYNGMSGAQITTSGAGVWSASSRGSQAYGYLIDGVNSKPAKLNRANAYNIRCVRDNIKRIH